MKWEGKEIQIYIYIYMICSIDMYVCVSSSCYAVKLEISHELIRGLQGLLVGLYRGGLYLEGLLG